MTSSRRFQIPITSREDVSSDNPFQNRGVLLRGVLLLRLLLWAAFGVMVMGNGMPDLAPLDGFDVPDAPEPAHLQVMMNFAFFIPLLAVTPGPGRFPARIRFWWRLTWIYCRLWFRLRCEGGCTVPREGPAIVVANHTCSIDPLLLTACTPWRLIGFMVAHEFYHVPIAMRLMRMIGCIPVRRESQDTEATRRALRHLKQGKVLGIFIEGGIRGPLEERIPKEGAAMLAARTGAVIVPAHISGTHYSDRVVAPFFRRHRAVVRFGTPINVKTLTHSEKPDRAELREITSAIYARIHELGEQGLDNSGS